MTSSLPLAQLAYNETELLYEVLKNFPLYKGVARDQSGNLVFDGHGLLNTVASQPTDAITVKDVIDVRKLITESLTVFDSTLVVPTCRAVATANVPLSGSLPLVIDGVNFTVSSETHFYDTHPNFQGYQTVLDKSNAMNQLSLREASFAVFPPTALFPTGTYMDPKHGYEAGLILLTNQTSAAENGIYDITISMGSYTLTRSTIHKNSYTEPEGKCVTIEEGNSYGGSMWVLTTSTWDYSSPILPYGWSEVPLNLVYEQLLRKPAASVASVSGSPTVSSLETKLNEIIGALEAVNMLA